jgi:hypothetical protein
MRLRDRFYPLRDDMQREMASNRDNRRYNGSIIGVFWNALYETAVDFQFIVGKRFK